MIRCAARGFLALALLAAACGEDASPPGADAGVVDAGGASDAGVDAGTDAGPADLCARDDECPAGTFCLDVGGYADCDFRPREEDVVVDEIDLGTVSVGSSLGPAFSGDVTIALPPDVVSLTVNARQLDTTTPLVVGFDRVREPDGTQVLDWGLVSSGVDQPLRNFPFPGVTIHSVLIPNTTPERLAIHPGTYTFRALTLPERMGSAAAELALTAFVKRADSPPTTGTLDLNVWTIGLGLDSTTAPTDTRIQDALAEVQRVYAMAGIGLGTITYHDVSAMDDARFEVIDSRAGSVSELAQLFSLSAARSGPAINLFMCRQLGGILGVAGGLPGPVAEHGTIRSGVAVAADPALSTAEQLGGIIAHELGHYLGLYHATETNPRIPFTEDPIADSPVGEDTNLMWPVALSRSRDVSPGQASVLRASALVR